MAYETDMTPSDIRFTHNSISDEFGRGCCRSLAETFQDLLYGDIDIDDLEQITVVYYDYAYWVVSGNRRLYIYQKLEEVGRLTTVPVTVKPINFYKFNKMKTTNNEGMSVRIRSDSHAAYGDTLDEQLDRIVRKWKRQRRRRRRTSSYRYIIYDY